MDPLESFCLGAEVTLYLPGSWFEMLTKLWHDKKVEKVSTDNFKLFTLSS